MTSISTFQLKKEQRNYIKQLKSKYSFQDLEDMSAKALLNLEREKVFQDAKIIFLYHSLNDEVNTHKFIEKWYKEKMILLPKIDGENMTLHPYEGNQNMAEGALKIQEPITEEYSCYENIDLAIIPGMAFDSEGYRLGRGKGFYDRFFDKEITSKIYKIGLAFSFQKIQNVAHEDHDIIMDKIITD